jgi:hypothetical protein
MNDKSQSQTPRGPNQLAKTIIDIATAGSESV